MKRIPSTLGVVALLAIAFAGCHPTEGKEPVTVVPPAGPSATAVDASVSAPAAAAVDAGAPPPALISGIFHEDIEPDERNLVIESDGTFFWRIYGCDFGGGGCGVWKNDGPYVILTPTPPAATMTWSDTGPVTKVILAKVGANLEAKVVGVGGKVVVQTWYPGQVCATCGGGLGPTAKLKACDRPLKKACP